MQFDISKLIQKLKMIFSKGFFKNSFFYFGVISVILFFIFFFSRNKTSQPEIDLANSKFQPNLFLGSIKNSGPESPELFLVQKSALVGVSPPVMVTPQVLGSIVGNFESEIGRRKEIIEYTVQSGDTLTSISENFEISLNTILWANNLSKNSVISLGQKLIILPVSGTIHYVQKGETLSEIAQTYKADVKEIIFFNELEDEKIFAGDILVIPDGIMPSLPQSLPSEIPLPNSYFISPTKGKISQGLHWYNAIDIANECGTPVLAVAGGEVQKIGNAWPSGNYIRILHSNGVVTLYGHLSKILVKPGDNVSQGDIIGYMGKTGLATGCHLHFEVRGGRNPLSKYLVGSEIKYSEIK